MNDVQYAVIQFYSTFENIYYAHKFNDIYNLWLWLKIKNSFILVFSI